MKKPTKKDLEAEVKRLQRGLEPKWHFLNPNGPLYIWYSGGGKNVKQRFSGRAY
jgi:hypothetical protein